ncbi:MAG: hypothetical protein OXG44_20300, partial [Gammaproteobacteria bacterium]|nr:hypothetical protein [Gammaproteobacteria bacterium]
STLRIAAREHPAGAIGFPRSSLSMERGLPVSADRHGTMQPVIFHAAELFGQNGRLRLTEGRT